jgi:hypothetical protein
VRTKLLGILSVICLALTVLWLFLLIWTMASKGAVETLEQALAFVAQADALFYLTYLNATLVTLSATMLLAGLYLYLKPSAPEWCTIGLAFVPVYSAMNLFVYVSQITVVPGLLAFWRMPEYERVASLLLGQMIQQWPDSAVAAVNSLAYAVLGIPSIIFGVALFKRSSSMRPAGILLVLNGVACIVGMVGLGFRNDLLAWGTALGGVLFLLALIPLSLALLGEARS